MEKYLSIPVGKKADARLNNSVVGRPKSLHFIGTEKKIWKEIHQLLIIIIYGWRKYG